MPRPSDDPKIRLVGVHKSFGAKQVLAGLDLTVGEGESVAVIGASGVGKSVMLKCLLGIMRPDAGAIWVGGREVLAMSASERERINQNIGMLFQGAALFDSLPVWENVAFGLLTAEMAREQAREVALAKLAQVGLGPEIADLAPAALSGGMKKRVGLARAIAADPAIILFDEPTTGLDPIMAGVINDLIVSCVREVGATALTITHDMVSARIVADRIAMIHDGRIIWAGPTSEIDDTDNPYVDQFINGRTEGPIKMAVRR